MQDAVARLERGFRGRIGGAESQAGREAGSVSLVAVSKDIRLPTPFVR